MGEALLQSVTGGIVGLIMGYGVSYLLGFVSIPITTPWDINLLPALAKSAESASSAVRLPVAVSASLTAAALALSLLAGALASYFMGRRTSRMKPVDILRRL
jgi:ABC-type antimicrobial peptide transport system permease subunit